MVAAIGFGCPDRATGQATVRMWLASALLQACFGSQFGSQRETCRANSHFQRSNDADPLPKRSGSGKIAKNCPDLQKQSIR